MSARIYCTYCDHRYLPRAVALIDSMERHGFDGEIWLYCLSDECYDALAALALPRVKAIRLAELEAFYPELVAVKPTRQIIEYYYSCAPAILHYAFAHAPHAEWVTFLDSDLWFYASPDRVFDEIGDAPVTIIPHNFTPHLRPYEKFGLYNVGWVSFRRCPEGEKCLEWWRKSCVEWCYGYIEDDRYADQKYLDRFIEFAPHTLVLTHKGCNLAPWNIGNFKVTLSDGKVMVDKDQLLFFHFSGLKEVFSLLYFDPHRTYGAQHTAVIRNFIYRPYIQSLVAAERHLKGCHKSIDERPVAPRGRKFAGIDFKNLARGTLRTFHRMLDLLQGRPIIVFGTRVI